MCAQCCTLHHPGVTRAAALQACQRGSACHTLVGLCLLLKGVSVARKACHGLYLSVEGGLMAACCLLRSRQAAYQ